MKVVAEADNGTTALEYLQALRPAVAVLDIDMPKLDGFAVVAAIHASKLPINVIFLTMHKEEEAFNHALDAGVQGYVLKDSAASEIVSGIRAVAEGHPFISPSMSAFLLNRNARATTLTQQRPGLNRLSSMERRILKLIAENKTTKEIAAELFLSPRTIDSHRANITAKLELQGSHALLKFAFDHKSELL